MPPPPPTPRPADALTSAASDLRPLLSSPVVSSVVSALSVEEPDVWRAGGGVHGGGGEPASPRGGGAAAAWRELRTLAALSAPLVAQNTLYLSQAMVVMAIVGQVRGRE